MKTFDLDKDNATPREEDFNIRIRPALDGDKWTGEIDISVLASTNSDLDEESYYQIMHFCTMICATVPLMEEDEDMREYVHDYVTSEFHERNEEEHINDFDIPSKHGNVVNINFKTGKKLH
jgi:hypothetical protein